MGQVAEDMMDGTCCQLCGVYFASPDGTSVQAHGHPVVCSDCWQDMSRKERQQYQRATLPLLSDCGESIS